MDKLTTPHSNPITGVVFTLLLTLATLCGGEAAQTTRRPAATRQTATTTAAR